MRLLLTVVCAALLLGGCSSSDADEAGSVDVVAAFYPLQFLAERIGGERVVVENLTPPGAEPHDLELTARQAARVNDAELVLYLDGFQPAVDEVAATQGDRALDLAAVEPLTAGFTELGEDEQGLDPHVWLDPVRTAALASAVADGLAAADPEGAAGYRMRADALRTELGALDAEHRTALTTCARRELVTSHNAFGYLTRRYGLEQVGIAGLSPDAEPTPKRLAEVAAFAKAQGVTTVFFEELVSPAVAETVAREVGARTAVLSTLEGAPDTGDYLSAMRTNLTALTRALGCT